MYKVLIKKVDEDIYEEKIDNDFNSVQNIVGGYIEYIHIIDEFYIACDEDGALKKLSPNMMLNGITLVGTVIIFKMGKQGGWKSLSNKEILVLKHLLMPQNN